ncbi:unnamed protein product [Brassicogethes aeneus]|uniref:R3H-associated N-terminal domain-containing protein n=1 Tax=Brassicogethes aeneus TaxID=1431903 RepID=A0A9P0BEB8_BRAAE|nr:unnamed protein product [Brassicogethes aeneus]
MTVIKRVQPNYNYPNSNQASDTESLNLGSLPASDTESINNEPVTVPRLLQPQNIGISNIVDLVHLKKASGKKKLRRYQNRCVLQTLNEDDENDNTIVMEPYRSPFTRLLEDNSALAYWNNFIEKSEEEQNKIMKAYTEKCNNNEEASEKPYGRISSKIRRTIKIRKNLSLEDVKSSEDDLISFFTNTPNKVYIKHPPTSFDRLLLHAIAQYHKLQSISILNEESARSIEIFTLNENWTPAECFLTNFIIQLRK